MKYDRNLKIYYDFIHVFWNNIKYEYFESINKILKHFIYFFIIVHLKSHKFKL